VYSQKEKEYCAGQYHNESLPRKDNDPSSALQNVVSQKHERGEEISDKVIE